MAYSYEYKISAKDKTIFKNAYSYAKNGQFDSALKYANSANDKLIKKIILWLAYQEASFPTNYSEVLKFAQNNPHWPAQKVLRNQSESLLAKNADTKDIIDFYNISDPVTGYGMISLAEAKLANGAKRKDIAPLIKQAWLQGDFTDEYEEKIVDTYNDILTKEDHYKRIDRLLWDEDIKAAKRMYPLLNDDHKNLVFARLQFMQKSHPSDSVIARVPSYLRDDYGLLYLRIKYYAELENFDKAYQILYSVKGETSNAQKWWKIRNRIARELLDRKEYKKAYYLARNHGGQAGSSEFAEAEWLAGWLALRFLDSPREAYTHFYNMSQNVQFPVSVARAAYWAGRAAKSNRNEDIADSWFKIAAKYTTSFYGQLAYLKENNNLALPPEPEMGLMQANTEKIRELLLAAYFFESIGQSSQAERFIKSAINSVNTTSEMSYISEFGIRIGRPNLSVVAAKEALSKGIELVKYGWPTTKYIPQNISVEPPFTLAIIRQESVFNPGAKSPANAYGLMQLIPPTAKRMAKSLKITYSQGRLLSDPKYNITLGSYYLESLIEQFNGSYILAICSYNAGPGNTKKWIDKYGDPRQMENVDDVLDWMESIPFAETRNYVQRVMENLQVYRNIGGTSKYTLEKDLKRRNL